MDKARLAVVVGVLGVWTASCIGTLVNPNLVTLAGITTPVISAVIAAIFADSYLKKRRNGNGNGHD